MAAVPEKRQQLIVVSMPGGSGAKYYKKHLKCHTLKPISDMFSEYSYKVAEGGDRFAILYDKTQRDLIQDTEFHGGTLLVEIEAPLDLWMRDFTSTIPDIQAKFRYQPDYLPKKEARLTEKDFYDMVEKFLHTKIIAKSEVILDGGNVVENGVNKAIITRRAVTDNDAKGKFSEQELKDEIEKAIKRTVCFIEDQGDTTGHSDGLVAFLDESTLLIGDYGDEGTLEQCIETLTGAFGEEVEIIKLPCYETEDTIKGGATKGFMSAEGCYINMLVTDNAVYVPVFHVDKDEAAVEVVKSHTEKKVLTVDTSGLAHLGGNVRCMSWQIYIDHPIAKALLQKAKPCN